MNLLEGHDAISKASATAELNRIFHPVEINPIPIEHALWDIDLIAKYLIRSPEDVRLIVKKEGFPVPIRVSIGRRQGQARYKAMEVIAWTLCQRG